MRKTWHHLVDHIMETEERSVTFRDLAEFVDNEARVAANPVFGKITEDAKPTQEPRSGRTKSGSDEVRKALLCRWAVSRIYLLESYLLERPPQLEMSCVLSAILATRWRPVRCLNISHIKTEFSSCCQNTSASVVYPLVTMPESARKGKYVR